MQSALDRLLDDSWRTAWPTYNGNTLAFDVYETDNAYTATVAIPGVSAEQINVSFHDGALHVSAEVPQPTFPENSRLLMQERSFGQFSRSIRLPQQIDASAVEATYENGVLTLNLPKTPEAQPKQIQVKTNGQKVIQSNN
jgi:HSP20 family protein